MIAWRDRRGLEQGARWLDFYDHLRFSAGPPTHYSYELELGDGEG
jgi:hypothetical protein